MKNYYRSIYNNLLIYKANRIQYPDQPELVEEEVLDIFNSIFGPKATDVLYSAFRSSVNYEYADFGGSALLIFKQIIERRTNKDDFIFNNSEYLSLRNELLDEYIIFTKYYSKYLDLQYANSLIKKEREAEEGNKQKETKKESTYFQTIKWINGYFSSIKDKA